MSNQIDFKCVICSKKSNGKVDDIELCKEHRKDYIEYLEDESTVNIYAQRVGY